MDEEIKEITHEGLYIDDTFPGSDDCRIQITIPLSEYRILVSENAELKCKLETENLRHEVEKLKEELSRSWTRNYDLDEALKVAKADIRKLIGLDELKKVQEQEV